MPTSETRYELLKDLPDAAVGDNSSVRGPPPAYHPIESALQSPCATEATRAIAPPSPLPALDADGNVVLRIYPAAKLFICVVLFVLGWIWTIPLWVALSHPSYRYGGNDAPLKFMGIWLPSWLWFCAFLCMLKAKVTALAISPTAQTITAQGVWHAAKTQLRLLNKFAWRLTASFFL